MPTTSGAAGVRADASDQCVGGLADERDVDHPTITNAEESGRQTAGERRDLPGFGVNAPDPAGYAFGDVERTIGADGAALAPSRPVTSRVAVGFAVARRSQPTA